MRFYSWFLIAFSFTFTYTALAQEKITEIVKKVVPSTVVILIYDKDGKPTSQGSGFFINKNGEIITNYHVMQGAFQAKVKLGNDKQYPITTILAEEREGDLIQVKADIPADQIFPLQLSETVPELGEEVVVVGSPMGLEKTVSEGIVSAVRDIPTFGKIIQITASISPGSSGSPIVNLKGEVIGVATFQMKEGQNLNFAIPSERIKKLKTGKGKLFTEWKKGNISAEIPTAEGLYFLGLKCEWADDYIKALTYFEQAIKKKPDYADAYFQIGYCNVKLGNNEESIEACKQAIRITPDLVEAHVLLGVVYSKSNQTEEAITAYKQAIRINPDFAMAHFNLGVVYLNLKRYEESIESYKQAIRIKPDYAEAHYNLGVIYAGLNQTEEAITAYKQAIRINPDFAMAYSNLGVIYLNLKKYEESIEACKQAIRITPDLAQAHYNLGINYMLTGNKNSSLDEYKVLKNLNLERANILFNLIYK